jgi:hypothetical protein
MGGMKSVAVSWTMRLIRSVCLFGWASACFVAPAPDDGEPPPSNPPVCPAGTSCPPPPAGECFGRTSVRCSSGKLTGVYGYRCDAYMGECELGCRQDYPPGSSTSGPGVDSTEAAETSRILCEEYRVEHGARRPGDSCDNDFDCLPFLEAKPPDGTPWSAAMSCVDGVCREQVPEVPADFGAPCTPNAPLGPSDAVSQVGIVVEGTCEHTLCNIRDSVPGDPGRCTMQCTDDAGCPRGAACTAVSIGPILNLYAFPSAKVCLDPCNWTDCSASTPDAGTADAGTPSSSAPADAG